MDLYVVPVMLVLGVIVIGIFSIRKIEGSKTTPITYYK
jgi:hypothetical protein